MMIEDIKTVDEAKAYLTSEIKAFVKEVAGVDVEVQFKTLPKRKFKDGTKTYPVGVANKHNKTITINELLISYNLNNCAFYSVAIKHEGLHMVHAADDKSFDKMLEQHGVEHGTLYVPD